ncbi:MAG: hypothetical protein HY394_00685 [Candidatus Diapherotrites archaeon]|nr:hypothetical protein [Candidatus Diapherotrites archaeon]
MADNFEFPESALVRNSFTFRKMDLPPEVLLTKRSLLRWFCLSFGLISEKESRSTVLEVVDVLFDFLLAKKASPSTGDIQLEIKLRYNKEISEKLLRYHVNRLIDAGIVVRKKAKYHINNSPYGEQQNLKESFSHWVKKPVNETMDDIENVIAKLAESYGQNR